MMDDAKYTFISDVKDRKSMLSGARSVKRGSKSKKCTLPSDYLSISEKKKLNGEVKTYKMKDPITWEQFKDMPKEHQENYLVYMIDTYHVTAVQLGEMMGISNKTLGNYLRDEGLNGYLPGRGHKMTKDQRAVWEKFLDEYAFQKTGKNISVSKRDSTYYQQAEDKILEPKKENVPVTESTYCKMRSFSISYEGDIRFKEIAAYLELVLGDKPKGHLEIHFTKE